MQDFIQKQRIPEAIFWYPHAFLFCKSARIVIQPCPSRFPVSIHAGHRCPVWWQVGAAEQGGFYVVAAARWPYIASFQLALYSFLPAGPMLLETMKKAK